MNLAYVAAGSALDACLAVSYLPRMNMSSDVADLNECALRIVDRDRVASVLDRLPPEEAVQSLSAIFGLLADPGRLRLLIALLEGEMCVCDLAAASGQSESSVSHALRLLRAHRVVQVRRAGRRAYYRLDDAHVRLLLDLALAHISHTDQVSPGDALSTQV